MGATLPSASAERRHLTEVDQHIAAGRQRLQNQEQLVEQLRAKGRPTDEADNLLANLVSALHALEYQRLLILDELSRRQDDR